MTYQTGQVSNVDHVDWFFYLFNLFNDLTLTESSVDAYGSGELWLNSDRSGDVSVLLGPRTVLPG